MTLALARESAKRAGTETRPRTARLATFGAFAREYVRGQFPDSKAIPGWVREAMAMAEIPLE